MLGTRLSSLRRMGGLSQNDLSRKVGLSQTQVCRIEQGERYPSLHYILRFCRALRLPPNEVLFDELVAVSMPEEEATGKRVTPPKDPAGPDTLRGKTIHPIRTRAGGEPESVPPDPSQNKEDDDRR